MSDDAEYQARISILVQHIEGDKEKFLSDLKLSIYSYVNSQTRQHCLAILTKNGNHTTRWEIMDGVPYVERLIAYLRQKPFRYLGMDYVVDSVLTDEVMDIVIKQVTDNILSHKDLVADVALTEILIRDSTRDLFLDSVLGTKTAQLLGAKGKATIASMLLKGIHDKVTSMSGSIASNLGDKISTVLMAASKTTIATTAVSAAAKIMATASGKIILAKFSMVIAKAMTPMLAKAVAMPAAKLALKKIIAAAVVAVFAKLIALKLGISIATAASFILIPILLIFLTKDIINFRSKLATALAEAICADLRPNYTKTITDVVAGLIGNLVTSASINEIATALAADAEVSAELAKMADSIAGAAVK